MISELEDLDPTEMTYAQIKVLAAGITLAPEDVEIVVDHMNRSVALIPDEVAIVLRAEIKHRWREFPGVGAGESRFFPPGSWVYKATHTIVTAYGDAPIPDGLDERDHAYLERGRWAARTWGQCAGSLFIIGRSGWDRENRWWRHDVRSPEHKRLDVPHYPNRVTEYGGRQRSGYQYQG